MALDANDIASIVEIAVYVPAIIVSLFVCRRHGFARSSGWLYTVILCLVRIVGGACQLAIMANPTSTGLITAAVLLESLGLTPLLLATLGLLSRFIDWTNREKTSPTITVLHFRLIQLLILVGTILGIVGATNGSHQPGSPTAITEAAVVLYVVIFVALVIILLLSAPSMSLAPEGERIIVPAVALALPFIAVRVLYSVLLVFVHSGVFVRIGGPIAVRVCMATIEEFIVVAIYLFLGFKLAKLDSSEQGEILSRPWKAPRSNGGRRSRRARFERYDAEQGQSTGGEQGSQAMGSYGYMQVQKPGEAYPAH